MKTFDSIDEILEFAMAAEQRAVDLYSKLAENAKVEDMRTVFMEFAKEEMSHKARLSRVKEERVYAIAPEKIQDMKIADYTGEIEQSDHMDYQEALVFAMNQEKAAFRLYTALADRSPNADLKNLFLALAQEEARHKLRFELEYDEFVLREN